MHNDSFKKMQKYKKTLENKEKKKINYTFLFEIL